MSFPSRCVLSFFPRRSGVPSPHPLSKVEWPDAWSGVASGNLQGRDRGRVSFFSRRFGVAFLHPPFKVEWQGCGLRSFRRRYDAPSTGILLPSHPLSEVEWPGARAGVASRNLDGREGGREPFHLLGRQMIVAPRETFPDRPPRGHGAGRGRGRGRRRGAVEVVRDLHLPQVQRPGVVRLVPVFEIDLLPRRLGGLGRDARGLHALVAPLGAPVRVPVARPLQLGGAPGTSRQGFAAPFRQLVGGAPFYGPPVGENFLTVFTTKLDAHGGERRCRRGETALAALKAMMLSKGNRRRRVR